MQTVVRMLQIALIALLAVGTLAAADPALLALMPADSTLLAGVHADRAVASRFGQYVLQRMGPGADDMEKLTAATGFDPRRDLREAMLASRGLGDQRQALMAARGTFDVQRLRAQATAHGAPIVTYRGVELLAGSKQDSGRVAFLNGSLAVAGQEEEVKAAVDRWRSGARPSAALAAKATEMSARNDAWFVSVGSPALLAGRVPNPTVGGAMKGDLIQAIEQYSGGARFGNEVVLSGEAVARSERDATALSDVVRFLVSLLQLNAGRGEANTVDLVSQLELDVHGRTVKGTLTIPEEQMERLLEQTMPPGRGRKAARTD